MHELASQLFGATGAHAATATAAATIAAPYLRFIPLAPLLGVLFHVFLGYRLGRTAVGVVACASVLVSFALATRAFLAVMGAPEGTALIDPVYQWLASGDFSASVTFRVDALASVMIMIVTGVGFLIHLYSTAYMSHDENYARFFAYLNLFMAAMLVLVLGDNLPLMFVGWEGVGLCSYLLIGFWYTDPDKASAGKKAFLVNRIGDAAFILGAFTIFWALADLGHASLAFSDINAHAASFPKGIALAAALLLFVGATGKSAQIPLYVWLPDAMAGPTPVSALIHAATMVTAGVYMVARLHGLYEAAPDAMNVVAVIGAATALMAATIGIAQNDIKKVLAYSTVSQLGYMFMALGVGAFAAGIFHVMTHAFFKALLFLGAGSVIHGLHEEQDIRRMGGVREKMPITHATFLVGVLAIAGVPGLSGFFSKDEILASAFAGGHYGIWAAGVLGAGMTAFYMTRLYVLTFRGTFRGDSHTWDHAHESPSAMTIPLIVLAALAVVGGYVGIPHAFGGHNQFGSYLAPSVGHHALDLSVATELALMGASVGAGLLGIAMAWRMYTVEPEADADIAGRLKGLYRSMGEAYRVDALYDRTVVQPLMRVSDFLWRTVDVVFIDGIANGSATAARSLGGMWRQWSTGNVQHYMLTVLIGVALVVLAVSIGVAG
ncbi:MAG TPA: NADH-quinone oxidoreductase subunit L [Candidatus Limnocylindrales bacterium]|nr:NADH-quinone oxidoreductase subunit L [Candidatus Limnocylindrales bacterium]